MPARNTYICEVGHKFEYIIPYGGKPPTVCRFEYPYDDKYYESKCEASCEISWDCEPGDYFGTMGLVNRL